jgi:hypothetical protein
VFDPSVTAYLDSGALLGLGSLATPPVPEPATFALMLTGLSVVGWAAARRAKSASNRSCLTTTDSAGCPLSFVPSGRGHSPGTCRNQVVDPCSTGVRLGRNDHGSRRTPSSAAALRATRAMCRIGS